MQIHELNTYDGTPDDSTYLALDDGSETSKVPATDIYPAMTQSQITSGVNTVKRVLTAAVLKPAIIAVAKTITNKWVDMTTPKIYLDTSAASGDDYDLTQALTSLGWLSDVVSLGALGVKKLLYKMLNMLNKSMIGTITDVYWWNNSWTAPSDGLMIVRITAINNASWYFYIKDTAISGMSGIGSWSHQFRGTDNNTVNYTIPVKKGAEFSTAMVSNVGTIKCLFYPTKVGGGTA